MNLHNQLDPITRRAFCERWASAALGVTVLHGLGGSAFAAEAAKTTTAPSGPGFGKAKNIIFLQMIGGST